MKDMESHFVVSAAELRHLQHLSLAFYMHFFCRYRIYLSLYIYIFTMIEVKQFEAVPNKSATVFSPQD